MGWLLTLTSGGNTNSEDSIGTGPWAPPTTAAALVIDDGLRHVAAADAVPVLTKKFASSN